MTTRKSESFDSLDLAHLRTVTPPAGGDARMAIVVEFMNFKIKV